MNAKVFTERNLCVDKVSRKDFNRPEYSEYQTLRRAIQQGDMVYMDELDPRVVTMIPLLLNGVTSHER
jgi:hypothetical protein